MAAMASIRYRVRTTRALCFFDRTGLSPLLRRFRLGFGEDLRRHSELCDRDRDPYCSRDDCRVPHHAQGNARNDEDAALGARFEEAPGEVQDDSGDERRGAAKRPQTLE